MTDSVDKVIIESQAKGVDETTAQINKLGGALDGLTVASDSVEKSTASLENKFASLERRFATSTGQASQFEKIQTQVNQAVANNPSLKDRGDDILAAASARYQQTVRGTTSAVNELGEAHNKLSTQGQALAHAIRSTVTEFSLGVPPTQILTQQFSHLTYAATGEGGLTGALKNVSGVFGGMITPMTASIGAVAALAAGVAVLANQYDKLNVSSQRAITGAGARTGTTVSDLNQFSQQNSGSLGTNFTTGLSTKEARALGEDLTKTGEITISRLHGMSDAVVGFANQTGVSMEKARESIVGFAVDPRKALDELAKTYGEFDVATRQTVDELVRADDKTGAFQVVIDALGEKSKKAAENMGFLERAARGVVNAIAPSLNPSGLENQLSAAQAKLAGAQSSPDMGGFGQENIKNLTKNVEELQAAVDKVNAAKAAAEINKLSVAADGVVASVIPEIAQLQKLKDALAELDRAKEAGAVSKQGAAVDESAALAISLTIAKTEQLQEATARANVEVAKISLSWGDVSQSTALALQAAQDQLPVISAITGQQQMAAQFAADYANAVIAGKTALEAEALAAAKLEASQAAATTSVLKQTRALEDSNAMIKARQNGTEKTTAAQLAYNKAIDSGADAASASALSIETARTYTLQASAAALEWQQNMLGVGAAAQQAAAASVKAAEAFEAAQRAAQGDNYGRGGDFGNFSVNGMDNQDQPHGYSADPNLNVSYKSGGRGFNIDVGQTVDALKLFFADVDKSTSPTDLKASIDNLKKSTDGLNATNQELLSPYYTQDPRTSHIGFRSQGMASGGEFVVPGGYSANDNMLGQIPLASGEIVSVRRPGESSGGGTNFHISMPVTIIGNPSVDQVKRTLYQSGQSLQKQLASSGR